MRRVQNRTMVGVVIGLIVMACGLKEAGTWWKGRLPEDHLGFTARQYIDTAGNKSPYIVFVPRDLRQGARPPLLLFLNGYGENGRDGARQISNNFGEPLWEVQRAFPMICLAPQCGTKWRLGSPDMAKCIAILNEVIKQYDVDEDRIYVTGVSAGGAGVWNMLAANPGRFAALVPLSATYSLPEELLRKALITTDLPIWCFYNDADPTGGLVDNTRNCRELLFDAGLSPVFTAYGQSHHDTWNAGYRHSAVYQWMLRQNRADNTRRAGGGRFQRLLGDAPEREKRVRAKGGQWRLDGEALRFDGRERGDRSDESFRTLVPADRSTSETTEDTKFENSPGLSDGRVISESGPSTLSFDTVLSDFELHFDYRSASDAGSEIVLESAESGDDVLRIRFESPVHGTGGLRHVPSGEWLGTINPVAQLEWLAGRWNDLRISLRDGELQLLLNGAELLVVRDQRLIGTHRMKLCVPAGEVNDREWRYLRLWDPNGAKILEKKSRDDVGWYERIDTHTTARLVNDC